MEPDKKEPNFSELRKLNDDQWKILEGPDPWEVRRLFLELLSQYSQKKQSQLLIQKQSEEIADFKDSVGYLKEFICIKSRKPTENISVSSSTDWNDPEYRSTVDEVIELLTPLFGPEDTTEQLLIVQLLGNYGERQLWAKPTDLSEISDMFKTIIINHQADLAKLNNKQVSNYFRLSQLKSELENQQYSRKKLQEEARQYDEHKTSRMVKVEFT